MIATAQDAERIVREIRESRPREVYIDLEGKVAKRGKGIDPFDPSNHVSGAAVKLPGKPASYLSIRHPESENLPPEALHDVWDAALEVGISNHNLRLDATMMHVHEGRALPTRGRDSMTGMTLEYENHLGPTGTRKGAYALKYRCSRRFGEDAVGAERELTEKMLARKLDPKADLWRLPAHEIAPYACDDVNLVERAFTEWLDPRMQQLGIEALAEEYYQYDHLLTRMSVDGMTLDRELVAQYLEEAERNARLMREQMALDAGKIDFNPASPVQARPWVNLPTTEKWRLKAAEKLGNERAAMLMSWRRWEKAVGTYYRPYLEYSDVNGVLHPSFWYTRTGRLTCFEPNLHATPHYGREYKMKDVWVAPPGHFLLYCDWSQAEMRLCAHYTQDPDLMRAFREGIDIHTLVAEMLGCDRQTAKPLNYGSAYGMGAEKLARQYGMTVPDAKKWLTKYHATLKGPRSLYKRMDALAQTKWWIRFWDGRYRRFSTNEAVRAFPHSASNSLLQGGVGAMSRRAMLALQDWCYSQGGRMWIQIHDAITFCLPLSMRNEKTYRHVKHVMEEFPFRVRMTVDMGVGTSWREASETKLKLAEAA